MPSHELLLRFQRDLEVRESWALTAPTIRARSKHGWNAWTRTRTARWWCSARRSARRAKRALAGWRLFLLSTEEMWGWRDGQEWMVSHHLLGPR